MGIRETIKKDIDNLPENDLITISEHIKQLKKRKNNGGKVHSLEEIHKMTATSKSNWAEDVIREREER